MHVSGVRIERILQPDMGTRLINLGKGAMIGTVAGLSMRIFGNMHGFWQAGTGISGFFTAVLLYGPRRRAIKLAVPITAFGLIVRAAVQTFLLPRSSLPSPKLDGLAGITGWIAASSLQGLSFLSSPPPPTSRLGPAVACAGGFITAVASSGYGILAEVAFSAFLALASDQWGYRSHLR